MEDLELLGRSFDLLTELRSGFDVKHVTGCRSSAALFGFGFLVGQEDLNCR